MDGSELIRFDHVTKRFGSNTVLDSLDFTVSSGKHVTLIGPSGSGKTTILRLLMTLLKPDEGTIKVGGEYLTHEEKGGKLVPAGEKHTREVRKNIGMVFQQFNLFPNMKVLRNITEAPVHVLGMDKDAAEERARGPAGPGRADASTSTSTPRSSPAASSSGSRSRGRWRCVRRCCCWTR